MAAGLASFEAGCVMGTSLRRPAMTAAKELRVDFFGALLCFLAADAQIGDGAGFEALYFDWLFANIANAKGAGVDFGEGGLDFLQQ